MKKLLFTCILALCGLAGSAQSFEGDVTYTNTFTSKIPSVTNDQFTSMAGNTLNYYIKGGDYRCDCNGTFIIWQLYINKDNKLYNKFSNSDNILWDDATVQKDSILSMELNKGVTEILGYKCDELVLNCKSGVQKYYYSSKLPIDSKLFSRHLYQNWYAYLEKAHAVPLKMIIDNAQFTAVSIATSVTPKKLDASMFILPAGTTTAKDPN
jgi:hypothetical protein